MRKRKKLSRRKFKEEKVNKEEGEEMKMKKKEGEEESLLYDPFHLNIDGIITHVSCTQNPPIGCLLIPRKTLNHYTVMATETCLICFLTMTPPVHFLPHSLLLQVSCPGFRDTPSKI